MKISIIAIKNNDNNFLNLDKYLFYYYFLCLMEN